MKAKTTILAFSGAFILACLQSAFPHFFTYRLCAILCLGMFGLSVADMVFRPFFPVDRSRWSRHLSFFSDAFPFLLLFGITTFSVAALNEKLYASRPEMHSLYDGWFTLGGFVPLSDSGVYLASIISFLSDGSMLQMAQSRPLPHLFSAVLYVMSGGHWMGFFQVSTVLVVVCVWFHGMIVARHAGRLVAVVSSGLLCWYFARFQATFLTELTGGCVGMVALSLLLHGFFERSFKAYGLGLVLFVLAMQMRSGVVLFLPVLVLVGGFRFRNGFRQKYIPFLACVILMLGALSLPDWQNGRLQKPIPRQSNAVIYLLQVMRNADTWRVIDKEYPALMINGRREGYNDRLRRASIEVESELKRHPDVFVRNYLSMIVRYAPRIERFLMPWADTIPTYFAWVVLLGFLLGLWALPSGSTLKSLSWLLLAYLFCCFLGLPLLYEISLRFYAVSMSLNTLITALAIFNLAEFAQSGIRRITGSWPAHSAGLTSLPEPGSEPRNWPWIFPYGLPILLMVLVVIGPIVIDRIRDPKSSITSMRHHQTAYPILRVKAIDVSKSPYVLLDPIHDFKVEDPLVMPRGKWSTEWKNVPLPSERTYWLLPSLMEGGQTGMMDSNEKMRSALLLPEKMLEGVRMSDIETLVLRSDSVMHPVSSTIYSGFFEVREILEIRLKGKSD
jgi:hypothetical protein